MEKSISTLPEDLTQVLNKFHEGRVLVLTGAGISAESGIPTFRGADGYWTANGQEYHPQEMATYAMFKKFPRQVWQWYLYRRTVCSMAQPNMAHLALVRLEKELEDRFVLITQNVDGLHLAAGQSVERTMQIHGNIHFMRCQKECGGQLFPIPNSVGEIFKDSCVSESVWEELVCPICGALCRPHVLWFDESYNEEYFYFDSAIEAAWHADLVIVVGTSGATNLPMQIGSVAMNRQAVLIDINPEPNPFSHLAQRLPRGFFVRGSACAVLPKIVDTLIQA